MCNLVTSLYLRLPFFFVFECSLWSLPLQRHSRLICVIVYFRTALSPSYRLFHHPLSLESSFFYPSHAPSMPLLDLLIGRGPPSCFRLLKGNFHPPRLLVRKDAANSVSRKDGSFLLFFSPRPLSPPPRRFVSLPLRLQSLLHSPVVFRSLLQWFGFFLPSVMTFL